jgi:hypothetical protein
VPWIAAGLHLVLSELAGHLDFLHPALVAARRGNLRRGSSRRQLSGFGSLISLNVVFKGTGRFKQVLIRKLLVALRLALLMSVWSPSLIYRQSIHMTRDALRVDTDQMLAIRSP